MLIPKHTTAKGVLRISVWHIGQDTCSAQDQYSERCFAPFIMVQQLLYPHINHRLFSQKLSLQCVQTESSKV